MSVNKTTPEIFEIIHSKLLLESDIRESIKTVVRDLEGNAREIIAILQAIHQPDGVKQVPAICGKARCKLSSVRELLKNLIDKLPEGSNEYYRFNDHWRFVMQRFCFILALVVYLETDRLITLEECADMLQLKSKKEDGFHVDMDDFLIGVLQLASELSRWSVNAVTAGDYGRPIRIAKFVGELDSGFRLLNLKNDSLRKRFDGLKYDLKKVEEIVYDVTIRGLKPSEETNQPSGDQPAT